MADRNSSFPAPFQFPAGITVTAAGSHFADQSEAEQYLLEHFKVSTLDGFGCKGLSAGVSAAASVLEYAKNNLKREVSHIRRLALRTTAGYMEVDSSTQRNLELVEPLYGTDRSHTLLAVLNHTVNKRYSNNSVYPTRSKFGRISFTCIKK